MIKFMKQYFFFIVVVLSFVFLVFIPISQAFEIDLTAAQESVGKRFANKFCEAKQEGLSSEMSSEFALNNTYLKFVSFPNDEKFIADLWDFTIERIRNDCGVYLTQNDESNLRDFFKEEGEIASNRDLYLPY